MKYEKKLSVLGAFLSMSVLALGGFSCPRARDNAVNVAQSTPPSPIDGGRFEDTVHDGTMYVILVEPDVADVPPGGIKVGCDDYVVPVSVMVKGSKDMQLQDAMDQLVTGTREYGMSGFSNSLAGQDFVVSGVSHDDTGPIVGLEGELVSAGTCDTPRIRAQVEQTVSAYYPKAVIKLNGSESQWRCWGDESGLCT